MARYSALLFALAAILLAALPVAAAAPAKAYVNVPHCALDRNSAMSVPGGLDMNLYTTWVAKTKTEVHYYERYAKLAVTVGGHAIANTPSYWGVLYYDPYDGGWAARWEYDAGVLPGGQSMNVVMKITLTRTISDGFATYPKGTVTYNCAVATF